jgi:uncharacterized membrane protein
MTSNPGPSPVKEFLVPSFSSTDIDFRFFFRHTPCIHPHTYSMSTVSDYKVASMALGFSLGFGFLTVWEAIKQTKRNRNPLRSAYIYMIWGEIVANAGLGVLGYLFLNGVIQPGYVSILKCACDTT